MRTKFCLSALIAAIAFSANAAEDPTQANNSAPNPATNYTTKSTIGTNAPVVAPAAPVVPAAPTAPVLPSMIKPAVTAPTAPQAPKPTAPQVASPYKSAVTSPTPANAPAKPVVKAAAKPASGKIDEATVRGLNKKYLVDFLNAAQTKDVRPFYHANPQFAKSITEAQFVNKFGKYTDLPNDIAAIQANDFADTAIKKIDDNKRYKGCQLIEAKSNVKLQIVQDSHNYKLTNRYCLKDDNYKLVSFKLGYEE